MSPHVPTLVLGAGAAGLICASEAGPGTLVIDHARAPGEKIRISGGGRCNFTNLGCAPENFLSQNPHFAKSALSRYSQWDFLDLVQRHDIPWHEKTLGQLFCDRSAKDIIAMLLAECDAAGASVRLSTSLVELSRDGGRFRAVLEREGRRETVSAERVVLATGGKSIPKMGASDLSLRLARQFGHALTETRPALVPLTFDEGRRTGFAALAGTAVAARIACNGAAFKEAMLFTHRGLSGPAVLQISSYWREGDRLSVHLRPDLDLFAHLRARRQEVGARAVATVLAEVLPKKLALHLAAELQMSGPLGDQSDASLRALCAALTAWEVTPTASEGYRTAEVMLGGVDTGGLSSTTMESRHCPGLYIIGEAVDVTGWLGGYNFQWAWSSGVAAGRAIRSARMSS